LFDSFHLEAAQYDAETKTYVQEIDFSGAETPYLAHLNNG
jgi:hypothetical protein